jgi:hypothetical protein
MFGVLYAEALIDTSKDVLEGNRAKYMLMSHHQNAGQNCNIKIANRSFKNVAKFRYLGMTVTNQNLVKEEIKRRLNACYHLLQNLLPSPLLSKIIKTKIYRIVILPVLCGCET